MAVRRSARALRCTAMLAMLGSLFAAAPAAAQADLRQVEIWLESPPSLAPAIDLRLSSAGADITDAECGAITTPSGSYFAQRQCADLGDGTFAVSLTGAPADAIVSWWCTDLTAASTDHNAIPLGNGFSAWVCIASVSPPGVVIDGSYSVDTSPFGDLDLVIEDGTGTPIGPCEVDRRGGRDRQWCTPLPDGDYRAVPQDVPSGYRAVADCTEFPSAVGSPSDLFTIDAQTPRWICEKPLAFVPLTFALSWGGATGRDRSWFAAAEPTIRDAGGTVLTISCTESQRALDDPSYVFVEYACADVAPGSYTVTFSGIPSDYAVESDSAPVVVPEQPGRGSAHCRVSVTSEPLVVPVDPDPPTLPDTGTASRTLLLVGLAALVSGTALLLAGRRRPPHLLRPR